MFSVVLGPTKEYKYIGKLDYHNYVLILEKDEEYFVLDEDLKFTPISVAGKIKNCSEDYIVSLEYNKTIYCYRLTQEENSLKPVLENKFLLSDPDQYPVYYFNNRLYTISYIDLPREVLTVYREYTNDTCKIISNEEIQLENGLLCSKEKIIDLRTGNVIENIGDDDVYLSGKFIIYHQFPDDYFIRDTRDKNSKKKFVANIPEYAKFCNGDFFFSESSKNIYEIKNGKKKLIITNPPFSLLETEFHKNIFIFRSTFFPNPKWVLLVQYFSYNIENLAIAIENEKDDLKRTALEIVCQHLSFQECPFDMKEYGW